MRKQIHCGTRAISLTRGACARRNPNAARACKGRYSVRCFGISFDLLAHLIDMNAQAAERRPVRLRFVCVDGEFGEQISSASALRGRP